jgi:DNA polymerase-4
VPKVRSILHADVDAFYASVHQRNDPALRGKPVIVGGGVVMAASYEARAYGVRGAMGGRQARRLCPHAIVVDPDWPAYVEASKQVFELFRESAPTVEGISMEEAFLDVTGLERIRGSPREIAQRLRREMRERVRLPVTVGVASSKLVAKIASGAAKPDGLKVVEPGAELAFLHPLPVEKVWGVGPATTAKLNEHGIATVGQAAERTKAELFEMLGPAAGRFVHGVAQNLDTRRVRSGRRRRSVGAQSALGRSTREPERLDTVLTALVDKVTRRMRSGARTGRTVHLRLRFADFSRATRAHTLPHATADTAIILGAARTLLGSALPVIEEEGCTLVGVAVSNIEGTGGEQLVLPVDGPGPALDVTLDEVRERFGTKAITRAALLGHSRDMAPWLLPGDE